MLMNGNQNELMESWQHEEQQSFTGWDFSHLDDRMLEDQAPWLRSTHTPERNKPCPSRE
jgi:hypothetical protein